MATQTHSFTYADLERARGGSHERIELIEGEMFVTPAPSLRHQDVLGNLFLLFRTALRRSGRGRVYVAPVDVRLSAQTVLQPDLVVVLADRQHLLTAARIEGAPNLTIEILSTSTTRLDSEIKRKTYANSGVPEYWIVDPSSRTITICSDPGNGRYQLEVATDNVATSATIPEMSFDLASVFADAFEN